MKQKTFIMAFTFIAASLMISEVHSQNASGLARRDLERKDSLDAATRNALQVQETKDKNTMEDAKADRRDTKAKAKNARRVEKDANDAAKQSKYALRSERRAQKSRKQANDQAEKASKARGKSDDN